jgi:2-methylcitrate dehydratase
MERLAQRQPLGRIGRTTFKRWPVGSRAQGAIQAALEARHAVAAIGDIRSVRVFTQDGIYDHLVRSRQDPWHPISRETADHSLPYIVAAAVLDGSIRPESFAPERVLDPARQRFLEQVTVEIETSLHRDNSGEFLSRIEIETKDGTIAHGRALPPPGHPAQPFTETEVIDKLRENTTTLLTEASVEKLIAAIRGIDQAPNVVELAAALTR